MVMQGDRTFNKWYTIIIISTLIILKLISLEHDENREKFATIGSIVYIIELLQYNQQNPLVII